MDEEAARATRARAGLIRAYALSLLATNVASLDASALTTLCADHFLAFARGLIVPELDATGRLAGWRRGTRMCQVLQIQGERDSNARHPVDIPALINRIDRLEGARSPP